MQKIKLTFVLLFVISIVGCNVANKNIKQNIDNNKQSNGIIVCLLYTSDAADE